MARRAGIRFRTGPFVIRLTTRHAAAVALLRRIYAESECLAGSSFVDFHVDLSRPGNLRRWFRPQILFGLDGRHPFEAFPLDQALPLFEWGLNWSIAMESHRFLMLHSAALERNGRALLLPALPGSGKSTLCTALAHRGWRLLSDEFGLIDPGSGRIQALPKAIALKNRAIQVIREHVPEAWIGPEFHGTRKGTVAHVKPPADSLERQTETAAPAWVAFPRYRPGAQTRLFQVPKGEAFTRLANNSFNYAITGEPGFRVLSRTVRRCTCYNFEYSHLEEALEAFHDLAGDA